MGDLREALACLALGESSVTPTPCPRMPQWVWIAAALALSAALSLLGGCSSERLPVYAESSLRTIVAESEKDIEQPKCVNVRSGYQSTVATICAILKRSMAEGRGGWVEYLVGAAGLTDRKDLEPPAACSKAVE